MPDRDARIAELAREILALVENGDPGEAPPPDPGALLPPANFSAAYDASTRRVTCAWTPQSDAVEIHERWKDPANTLKATLPPGAGVRVSSQLAGGPYEWAARSVRDGAVSEFTEWILTDVPREGDEYDEEEPDGELPGEEPGEEPTPGVHPSDVLPILRHWTIMLPTGSPGDPDNDYLVGESVPDTYFVRDDEFGRGVVFRCHPATANHSPNSKYGRCEARQMVPPSGSWEKSAWSSREPHLLRARLAIDTSHLDHPIVNGLQIHDGGDDVIQVQARNGVLGIAHDDGDSWEPIDVHRDGVPFDMTIDVTGGDEIVVVYNGVEVLTIPKSGSGWYWKAGCYPNTGGANSKRVEAPENYAEVVLYDLQVDPL